MMFRAHSGMWLLLIAANTLAQPVSMTLLEVIRLLEARDIRVVYSSAVVREDQVISVVDASLEGLGIALGENGLKLDEVEGVWIISRLETTPPVNHLHERDILETVVVTGSLHRLHTLGSNGTSVHFTAEEMAEAPTLGSDALRATLRLPGVSSLGVSAKPRIRGGLQDELLVMQDGIELMEPFHLADYHSPYSSIDVHTIESLNVYTGGFPSRYGYRMSGVMDIRNQWQDDKYNTDIGLSSFSNFIHTRGEFGERHPASWLLSARRGDLTDLTEYIETRSGDPRYSDVSARINVGMSDDFELASGLAWAEDDIRFDDAEERATSLIDTGYLWLSVTWVPDSNAQSRLTLSWLDFERDKRQASFELDEEDPGKGGFLNHQQKVKRLALRNDWSVISEQLAWEFGWQLEHNRGDYHHRAAIDRGELAVILGTEEDIQRDITLSSSGWSGGVYAQAEWEITPKITLQPSLRWDFQNYYIALGSEQQVSPRLGLKFQWNDATQFRLSMGRFHQQEGIQEIQVIDGVTHFFEPQHSDQVVAAVQWQEGKINATGELYYKRYRNLKGRFENIFNPYVLLPEMEPDRVSILPDRAVAKGADLDIKATLSERLAGYFRYSYMDARDRVDDKWIDRRWSQQHTVNTGVLWRHEGFSAALGLTWHSGWRSSRMPAFISEGETVPVTSVLNNTELNDYVSVDINVRKHWVFPRFRVEVYADIVNLTNRKNEAGIDFDINEVENGYELSPDRETLLGRVPSLGVTLSF